MIKREFFYGSPVTGWEEIFKRFIKNVIDDFYGKTNFSWIADKLRPSSFLEIFSKEKPSDWEESLRNNFLKFYVFEILNILMFSFEKVLITISEIIRSERKIENLKSKVLFAFYSFVFLETLVLLLDFVRKNLNTIFLKLDFISSKKLIEIISKDAQSEIEKFYIILSSLDLNENERNLIFTVFETYSFLEKFFDLFSQKPEYFWSTRLEDERDLFGFLRVNGLEIPQNFFKLINLLKKEIENLVKDLNAIGKVIKESISLHQRFNKESKVESSFHNENHIEAVLEALEKLIIAAKNGNDPLNIRSDLERWNKENNVEPPITLEEFWFIALIAFACHDLGNIATLENEKLIFLSQYTSKDAEERSKRIAEYLLNQTNLDETTKQIWLPLIFHLIDQTKFQPEDTSKPFAIFVRVVDQIGGNLFNKDRTKSILGLIYEIANEGRGNETFNPHSFYNFPYFRFQELVLDEEIRKAVLNIWEKEIKLEENSLFPNQEITYSEYLQKLGKTNN
ncbi:hypothetical protein HRbin35_00244 [bacterium HR35]|nr:hypothetical protein HRbin35_00244 [bacterium HR35]